MDSFGLGGVAAATMIGTNSLAPAMAWGFTGHLGKAATMGVISALLLAVASFGWRKHHQSRPGTLLGMFVRS